MLDSGDTGGRSRQACTALAEGCRASAVHREVYRIPVYKIRLGVHGMEARWFWH